MGGHLSLFQTKVLQKFVTAEKCVKTFKELEI